MVKEALGVLNITEGILTIILVGDRKIRKLNREFFQKDHPTNVLSFSYREEGKSIYHKIESKDIEGDIIVSLDTVLAESDDGYLSEEERVFFYVLHGILHIIGYDHVGEIKESRKMRKMETTLFKKITGKDVV
jgi:probable rRNA maturation factor